MVSSLSGKLCVVTGANSGVGKATTRLLAEQGARVAMVCRNERRGERARREIVRRTDNSGVSLLIADLSSLAEVRRLAATLVGQLDRLDLLVNNAGVYRARREISADGFEMTMAVNHLAHFLLTHLMLDHLRAAEGQVVNVSSQAHHSAKLSRMPLEGIIRGEGGYRGLRAYSDSKLANVLFTFELARWLGAGSDVTTNALHPGVLATRIWSQNLNLPSLTMRVFKPFLGRPRRGGKAIVRLAVEPGLRGITGRYFDQLKESRASEAARDTTLAARLWELSNRLTGSPA